MSGRGNSQSGGREPRRAPVRGRDTQGQRGAISRRGRGGRDGGSQTSRVVPDQTKVWRINPSPADANLSLSGQPGGSSSRPTTQHASGDAVTSTNHCPSVETKYKTHLKFQIDMSRMSVAWCSAMSSGDADRSSRKPPAGFAQQSDFVETQKTRIKQIFDRHVKFADSLVILSEIEETSGNSLPSLHFLAGAHNLLSSQVLTDLRDEFENALENPPGHGPMSVACSTL